MKQTKKMERAPVYNKDGNGRVISGPNETWIPQEKMGKGSREYDPWQATRRPQRTKQEAMALVPNMPKGGVI
jgi:hypothetical protein